MAPTNSRTNAPANGDNDRWQNTLAELDRRTVVEAAPPHKLNKFLEWKYAKRIIETGLIPLLSPENWPDENDRAVMAHYAQLRRQTTPDFTVLASCFLCGPETVYHWKSFAEKEEDVCCIEFEAKKFIDRLIPPTGEFLKGKVKYRPWAQLSKKVKWQNQEDEVIENLPFFKRWPFRCEDEYRVVWGGDQGSAQGGIHINVQDVITKVNLSPKLPKQEFEARKQALGRRPGIEILHSTLNHNKDWMEAIQNIGTSQRSKSKASVS